MSNSRSVSASIEENAPFPRASRRASPTVLSQRLSFTVSRLDRRQYTAASFTVISFMGFRRMIPSPIGRRVASSSGSAQPRPPAVAPMTRSACRVDVSPSRTCDMFGSVRAATPMRQSRMCASSVGRLGAGKPARRLRSASIGVDVDELGMLCRGSPVVSYSHAGTAAHRNQRG